MKRAIGIALFAFTAIAVAYPSGQGKTPANQLRPDLYEEPRLVQLALETWKNINIVGRGVQEQPHFPKQEGLLKAIKAQGVNLVSNLQEYIAKVDKNKNKSPELEKIWTLIKSKLPEIIDDINAQMPDYNQSVQESDKTAKAISDDMIKAQQEIAKWCAEIVLQAAEKLNNRLKQASAALEA